MCVCDRGHTHTHTDVLLSRCSIILGLFQRSSTRRGGQLGIVFTLLLHIMAAKMFITLSSFRFFGGASYKKLVVNKGAQKVNSFLSFVIFFFYETSR